MKENVRILARLDIKGPNLVKGVHLEGLRVVGRPELFAPQYYEDGIDELIYIDQVASLYGRNNLTDIVRRAAGNIFVPLTVGGGIRSVDDMRMLLRAGADKIAINTAAIENPALIDEGAQAFGSQCIVLSVQARRTDAGGWECLTHNAREKSGRDAVEWVREAVRRGAGEILLTSVDRDGTGKGYDIELVSGVTQAVNVPVIACGGAGKKEDFLRVVNEGRADAVAAASVFHYAVADLLAVKSDFKEEGNIEFLKKALPIEYRRKNISPVRIGELKTYLAQNGVPVRCASELSSPNAFVGDQPATA